MEEQPNLSNDELRSLRSEIYARAETHRKRAARDTLLTIASILLCLAVFTASDALRDVVKTIVMTKEERAAQAEMVLAKAKLMREIANLSGPAAEIIRISPGVLVDIINERLDIDLRRYIPADKLKDFSASHEQPIQKSEPEPRKAPEPIALSTGQSPPSYQPQWSAPVLGAPTAPSAGSGAAPQDRAGPEGSQANRNERLEIARIEADSKVAIAEIEVASSQSIATTEAMSREAIATTETMTKDSIANQETTAQREIAAINANTRSEEIRLELDKMETASNFMRDALTKVGAFALLIWLVRVFNANRQKNENISQFYRASADALWVKNQMPAQSLTEILNALIPPDARGTLRQGGPGDDLLLVASEAIRAARQQKG